jgi:hypothetical protein
MNPCGSETRWMTLTYMAMLLCRDLTVSANLLEPYAPM